MRVWKQLEIYANGKGKVYYAQRVGMISYIWAMGDSLNKIVILFFCKFILSIIKLIHTAPTEVFLIRT